MADTGTTCGYAHSKPTRPHSLPTIENRRQASRPHFLVNSPHKTIQGEDKELNLAPFVADDWAIGVHMATKLGDAKQMLEQQRTALKKAQIDFVQDRLDHAAGQLDAIWSYREEIAQEAVEQYIKPLQENAGGLPKGKGLGPHPLCYIRHLVKCICGLLD